MKFLCCVKEGEKWMEDSLKTMNRIGLTPTTLTLYHEKYKVIRELKRDFKDFETTIGLWEYKLNVGTYRDEFQHISPDLLGVEDFVKLVKLVDKEGIGLQEWERRMEVLKKRIEYLYPSLSIFLRVYYPKYRKIRQFIKEQFHYDIIRALWKYKL